jgi:hypothetical protein
MLSISGEDELVRGANVFQALGCLPAGIVSIINGTNHGDMARSIDPPINRI